MGLIGIWLLTFGGPRTSFGALNFSIIFLLLIDPFLATNWGFMLSVAATAGLILLAPQIQKLWVAHLPKTPKFLMLLITMTLSAQLVTYLLIGFMVGEISLISLAANALAMPTVAWVTVFGFLTLISATVAPPLSIIFIYLALPAAIWIEFVANSLAKFPFAQISFSSVTFFALITAVSAVVGYKYRNLIRISLLEERK
ncbi:MAG: ComEC/Rec2 family competence protein [Candidatus Nanopelagicales bacterium]